MAIAIRPITLADGTNNPSKQVSKNVWNQGHQLTASPEMLIGTDGSGVAIEYPVDDFLSFTQDGSGATQRTVQDKLRDTVSVKDFGATGDGVTDDTAAIQAGIGSLAASGGMIYFPRGDYKTTAVVTVGGDETNLRGAGIGATRLIPSTLGQVCVAFAKTGGGILSHCSISDMDVSPAVLIGDCITVSDHYWFTAERLRLSVTFDTGINIFNGSTSYIAVLRDIFTNGGAVGVRLGEDGTGDLQNVFLYNCHLDTASDSGLRVANCGGLMWIGGEALFCNRSVIMEPAAGQRIKGVFMQGLFLDTAANECLRIAFSPATGRVSGVSLSNVSLNFSTAGTGVVIAGPSADPGQLERIRFDSCDIIINNQSGVYLTYCRDIEFNACNIVANGLAAADAHQGILADTGVVGLRINGGSIGAGDEFADQQQYGLKMAGISQVRVNGVDFSGNITAAIFDPGVTDLVIRDCVDCVTYTKGWDTVLNGTSSINVAHGLDFTPDKFDITITPISALVTAVSYYVSAATSTTFTLTTNAAVGANFSFAWSARVKGA